ncbi:MAG: hypothetical protein ABIK65_02560 [Candidatus Eisenbacteria bacterium]
MGCRVFHSVVHHPGVEVRSSRRRRPFDTATKPSGMVTVTAAESALSHGTSLHGHQ